MIMKNPKVEFCGYSGYRHLLFYLARRSVPHPSENHINIRIQMYDNLSSLDCLLTALSNLDDLCLSIGEAYKTSLTQDEYEKWDEKS
ncbi:hypothetical protein EUX98_g1242 [Antrodiella citrinella]|uniref:DNA-directed RNA polymerase RBP11-like dimerisation domain-containing protein n=1 Tax=Antrodiella citrinella TaxID=2447956 RepID=A0A4S4N482_9APHY|nr:hypothetical protein EUX98_g1242 [Antrodiella citrinella]